MDSPWLPLPSAIVAVRKPSQASSPTHQGPVCCCRPLILLTLHRKLLPQMPAPPPASQGYVRILFHQILLLLHHQLLPWLHLLLQLPVPSVLLILSATASSSWP